MYLDPLVFRVVGIEATGGGETTVVGVASDTWMVEVYSAGVGDVGIRSSSGSSHEDTKVEDTEVNIILFYEMRIYNSLSEHGTLKKRIPSNFFFTLKNGLLLKAIPKVSVFKANKNTKIGYAVLRFI